MALCGRPDEDQRRLVVVVVAHGGPRLESSQQLSSPGYASDQAWYRHRTSVPTQDFEIGIPGKKK